MLLLEIRTTRINCAKRKKRDDSLIIREFEEGIIILENTIEGGEKVTKQFRKRECFESQEK